MILTHDKAETNLEDSPKGTRICHRGTNITWFLLHEMPRVAVITQPMRGMGGHQELEERGSCKNGNAGAIGDNATQQCGCP